jgi:hypothetical protein
MNRLHAAVAQRCVDSTSRIDTLSSGHLMMSAAYLIPGPEMDLMTQRVRRIARRIPSLRVLCTGPWPPYHFVPRIENPSPESIHG